MDFWGYVLIAFGIITLIETAVCCALQRRTILGFFSGRDHRHGAASALGGEEGEGKDSSDPRGSFPGATAERDALVSIAVPKEVVDDFRPYTTDTSARPPARGGDDPDDGADEDDDQPPPVQRRELEHP